MKDDRGAVIVIVALLLSFVFLGMAAISVDVGYLYLQRRHLQNTADAAALAAAWHLPWGGPQEDLIDPTAQEYIINNNLNDVTGTVTDPYGCGQKVKVEITNDYSLFFAAAPPIGQSEAEVYSMAVAEKRYTFIDLLPFLMLKYDDVLEDFMDEIEEIDDLNELLDHLDDEYDDWENNKNDFYDLMKDIVPVDVNLLVKSTAGNWGIADMRDFVDGMSTSGEIGQQEIHEILKHGLTEPFCSDDTKMRKGTSGVISAIDTNVPSSVDGMTLSDRLEEHDDFFMPLIVPGLSEQFQGSHSSFGLDDFIIGHFRNLSVSGSGNNRVMSGELIEVYLTCEDIADTYKMWIPALVE